MQIETRSLKFIEQIKHIQIYWRIGGIRYPLSYVFYQPSITQFVENVDWFCCYRCYGTNFNR